MPYSLQRQPNGSYALHHGGLRETMHPQVGPWQEATRLYAEGTRLAELLQARPGAKVGAGGSAGRGVEVVVFDVGLGGAANALAAFSCRAALVTPAPARQAATAVRPLRVVSFEQDLEALEFALQHVDRLTYLSGHEDAARALLADGAWRDGAGAAWELRQGDFTRLIGDEPLRADAVFLDPFSPHTNPAPWSLPAQEALFGCRRHGGLTRLATYSSAFGVRAALLLAGWFVGEGPRQVGRSTTLASTAFSDLAQPLDLAWLARWRRDREPWPPLSDPTRHRALRAQLLDHPQWSQFSAAEEGREPRRAARSKPVVGRAGASPHPDSTAQPPSGPTGRTGGSNRRGRPGGHGPPGGRGR